MTYPTEENFEAIHPWVAESLQRIIVPRALAGQHPQSPQEIIDWLEQTVAGWNREPTPFTWGGKRKARRERARQRRLAGSGQLLQVALLFPNQLRVDPLSTITLLLWDRRCSPRASIAEKVA